METTKVAFPSFRGAIFSLSNVLIQSSINSFGANAMAGNTAACNLEGFVYVAMNSVHHTCLSFTSQNYGAQNFKRIKKILIECLAFVTIVGVVLGTLSYIFGEQLLSIYAASEEKEVVIQYGMLRMFCNKKVLLQIFITEVLMLQLVRKSKKFGCVLRMK